MILTKTPLLRHNRIFEGTSFQLRRLELRMDYDSALIDFLTHQPELRSLTLLGAVPDHLSSMRLILPASALPKLAHFHGHYTQALALVPHRPVRRVHITQVDDSGEFEPSDIFVCLKDTVETLVQSTGPLEELTFDDEDGDYGLLEVVLCSMPSLRSINLFVPQHGCSWVNMFPIIINFGNQMSNSCSFFSIGTSTPNGQPTSKVASPTNPSVLNVSTYPTTPSLHPHPRMISHLRLPPTPSLTYRHPVAPSTLRSTQLSSPRTRTIHFLAP